MLISFSNHRLGRNKVSCMNRAHHAHLDLNEKPCNCTSTVRLIKYSKSSNFFLELTYSLFLVSSLIAFADHCINHNAKS